MNVQYLQTKVTTASSVDQKRHTDSSANGQRNHDKISTRNDYVTISQQGRSKYIESLQFKQVTNDDQLGTLFRQFYEEYHRAEAIEQRQLEQMQKEQAYNRLKDEFHLQVEYHFPENTLQHTIKEALEGKVVNASLYAAEFASALRSSVSMPDKSVEERAAYREMALKQAEYIAEHYFHDEQEAASFMNEIRKYYDNDVLREKGYVVIDQSDLQSFKSYSSPISNGDASFYTLAKKYMDEDTFERFIQGKGNPAESAKFLLQLKNINEHYRNEFEEEFELHERQVEAQIRAATSMLESLTWDNGRVTGTIGKQPKYLDEIVKWNNNMLHLFQ